MPDLQIPSVTLEDLQAFQATHFPGSAQPPHIQDPYNDAVDQPGYEYEEDDLGYYPDGVKRTLTDEQIRIFRHSEIHSLLRERQLREEALREAAEEESEEATETQKVAASDAENAAPTNKHERPDDQEASGSALDYGEDASAGTAQKRARSGYTSHFVGRRIISYDD